MKKRIIKLIVGFILLIIIVLIAGGVYAQDPGNPDSVIIEKVDVPYSPKGDTICVRIGFITDEAVGSMNLPITWNSSDGRIIPWEIVWGELFNGMYETWDTTLYSPNIMRNLAFGSMWQHFNTYEQMIWGLDLYFIILPGAIPQTVILDTIDDPICGMAEFGDSLGYAEWHPKIQRGYLRYAGGSSAPNPDEMPYTYSLKANYPNPFNIQTVIGYSIPEESAVNLAIFDILGKKIATLCNEKQNAGEYQFIWSAENIPSGIYFYKLQAGDYRETRKMILMK
jgi:hypothetical protein